MAAERVKELLNKHSATIDTIESVVQAATWLLPDDANTELLLEALSALMGVLSVFRDPAVHRPPGSTARNLPGVHVPPPLFVAVLQQTEVLVEVAAKRFIGGERKWSVLALMEAAKAWARLHTLQQYGGGVLIDNRYPSQRSLWLHGRGGRAGPAASAEQTLRALAAFRQLKAGVAEPHLPPPGGPLPPPPPSHAAALVPRGAPPGRASFFSAILAAGTAGQAGSGAGLVERCMLRLTSVAHELACDTPLRRSRVLVLGETLHVMRPLVYCLAVRHYGRRSWRPWAAALACDLGSRAVLTRHVQTDEEMAELSRRRVYLLYYLLSSPAYETGLRRILARGQRSTDRVPGLGTLYRRAFELIDSLQDYHTYTTTS